MVGFTNIFRIYVLWTRSEKFATSISVHHVQRKAKRKRSHNASYCLIEVVNEEESMIINTNLMNIKNNMLHRKINQGHTMQVIA
jgi:rRNA-processing protein FCF1